VLGKLADRFGRKAVYYIGPLVSGVAMSVAVLATRGTSLPVLLAHRALGWALISMSCSFIVPVSVSDMFSGQALGVNIAQVFATMGMGMVIAPYLGMVVMVRTGSALNVYKLRAASALVQLAVLFCAIPETLEASKVLPVTLASLNPFRFIAIARAPRTLRTLAATLFFNCESLLLLSPFVEFVCLFTAAFLRHFCLLYSHARAKRLLERYCLTRCPFACAAITSSVFAEGKNIISLIQVWMVGNPLNWSVEVQARCDTLRFCVPFS
jgi:MFS family permease